MKNSVSESSYIPQQLSVCKNFANPIYHKKETKTRKKQTWTKLKILLRYVKAWVQNLLKTGTQNTNVSMRFNLLLLGYLNKI